MKKVTQTLSRPPFGLDKILVAVISKIKYILVSIKPQKINIYIYIILYRCYILHPSHESLSPPIVT